MAQRVGGDVDAYCTKCKMVLGHTILAMVGSRIARVRCNTCQGEHAYKAGPPGTKAAPRARGGRADAPARAEAKPFSEIFKGRDTSKARKYSARETFAAGDIVQHPTFGLGLVEAARGDKIDVVFESGEKKLVQGGGARTPVEFKKPGRLRLEEETPGPEAALAAGAADKPPPGEAGGIHVVHAQPLTELPPREQAAAVESADSDGAA